MAATDPTERSRIAGIASDVFWSQCPDRSLHTRKAHTRSPASYEYWLDKITEEGIVRPQDRHAAAENAHRAYMRQQSKRAAEARRRRATT